MAPTLPDAALTDDYLLENMVIAGSPETVARQLSRLRHQDTKGFWWDRPLACP